MYRKAFSLYDIFVTFLSFASFILDVITDVAVIVLFFRDGHTVWGAVSLALVALSTFAMQIFSFCWHVSDGTMTVKTFLLHACFLAPLHRFWRVLQLGFKSRRTKSHDDLEAVYSANNDVCLLRLFESFLESAPQLTLQLYIIITFQHFDWILGISTFFSLTSIAWSVSAYSDGLRLAYQDDYRRSGPAMLVHTLWQIAMISGRVLAIVVFASHFQAWTFLLLGVHWLLMTAWITFQNADFGDSACEKRIFNAVSGFIYIFCFLNLKDGPTCGRQTIYYIITLVENTVLVIMWFSFKPDTSPDWMNIATPTVIYGGFVLGSAMMCLYYFCCHPSKPKAKREQEIENNWFKRIATMKRKEQNPTVFNTSDSSFRISEWLTTSINLSNCDRQNNSVQMSLNSSVPDVVPEKRSAKCFSGKSLSTYHRAASIESSLQESEGNLTMESGRVSYASASSIKPLISSASKTSTYRFRAEVNKAWSPQSEASSAHALNYRQSPKSQLNSSDSWNLGNDNSSHRYDTNLSQREDSPGSVQSWRRDAVVPGSGNSTFEYSGKKLSMSPLDPTKLWELSQQRITTPNSSDLHVFGSSCVPKARENVSYHMNNELDAGESNISGGRGSSVRTSHYSTTFSDSQYNSNSEVSGERYDTNHSNSGTSRSRSINQFNSLSQTESSEPVQSSELSNFFADISSLHVPASDQNRYISSASESTDFLNSSFPWPHDHAVFYDEGDISELVYKQNIRESLLGKSYMYHICPISDATRLGELSRGPFCNEHTSNNSYCTNCMAHTSDSMTKISTEKSTDDSGYNYSEEAENNESWGARSKGFDSVKSADIARLSSRMSGSSISNHTSPIRSDHTGGSTPKRHSLLPGLSYLMSDSDTSCLEKSMQSAKSAADSTLQHNSKTESFQKPNQNVKVSPLQVSVIDTSPNRLGRSVDLFNSSRQELSDFEAPNIVHSNSPVISPKSKIEQLRVLELKESPYKFRGHHSEDVPVRSTSVKKKDELSLCNLTESPYKFRSQGFENTSRKFYTIPEKRGEATNVPYKTKSQFTSENKENRIMDGSEYFTAPSRNRKKKEGNVRLAYKGKHSKPRNRVSALRNSCYAYSDTDSDGEVASNFSSRSQYGDDSDDTYGFSPYKTGNKNFGKKDSRTALRSMENTPIFSPIVTPDRLDREKVCNASGPIMKPVFSTPVPRGEGIDNTLFVMEKPSTIAV